MPPEITLAGLGALALAGVEVAEIGLSPGARFGLAALAATPLAVRALLEASRRALASSRGVVEGYYELKRTWREARRRDARAREEEDETMPAETWRGGADGRRA